MKQEASSKINILGLDFDNITVDKAVKKCLEFIADKKVRCVFTPNAEIMQGCIENSSMLELYRQGDLILPDGIGIIHAARILGIPLQSKVAGIDVAKSLLSEIEKKEYSLFLLGGRPGIAKAAAQNIRHEYHNIKICGTNDGYFAAADTDKIIDKISDSGADVVFVCFGAPKQEQFVIKNKDKLPPALYMGLGGSIDIFAGAAKRAPALFIRFGLEWLYRLLKQPSRLGRMMKLPKFIMYVKRVKKAGMKSGQ